jgi:hypothetical protein
MTMIKIIGCQICGDDENVGTIKIDEKTRHFLSRILHVSTIKSKQHKINFLIKKLIKYLQFIYCFMIDLIFKLGKTIPK